MNSISESFDRAFRDKSVSNNQRVANESDSDSAEEQKKTVIEKRQKKRRRNNTRSKVAKNKRVASQFKVRRMPPKESVTAEKYPEILSVEAEFSMKSENKELPIAEQQYFNAKNKEPWTRGDHDHVLPWHFPFVRALIQRDPCDTFDIHVFNDRKRLRAKIEPVSRKYEEAYLREPIGSERPCLLGKECEGLKITMAKDKAFVMREFLLPSEQKQYEETGKLRPECGLCLMCRRKEISRAFINIRADAMAMRTDSILQDYRNIVDVEGEYCLKDCIVSSRHTYEGLTDPVVLHIRSAYRLVEKNGIRHYEQWRMGYPASNQQHHFQQPSH